MSPDPAFEAYRKMEKGVMFELHFETKLILNGI